MNLKCAIIDDEPLARQIIKDYLKDVSWLELVFEADNALSAIELLNQHNVDLLLLDIKMPGITGIQFLKILKHHPNVIITTAYREYAIDGFDLEVIDYLLKPFSFERFLKGVSRVLNKKTEEKITKEEQSILLKVDKQQIHLMTNDIAYIQSLKDYVKVFTVNKMYISYRTLSGITEELPSEDFVRVHRSYTINLKHLKVIEGNRVTVTKASIPIGKHYKKDFLNRLD